MDPMDRPVERLLKFFRYDHLPLQLQEASKPFCDLAEHIVTRFPRNAERTAGLRKLLEAKDCAVRSLIEREDVPPTR